MDRVDGKIAIVTGGAQGLGEAAVKRLTGEGAIVILTDSNTALGTDTANKYGAGFFHHDVRAEDQWQALMAKVIGEHGRVDILVNNAGIYQSSKIDETTLEDFRRVIDINLVGCFLGCKHGVRAIKHNPDGSGGSIINLSSVSGLRGQIGNAAYGSSKAGVALLTKTVAVENATGHIRCNSIHPGVVHTPMFDAILDATGDKAAKVKANIMRQTPMGNLGTAQDIADMVVFLASDESQYITGAEMIVDGGASAGLPY